MMDSVSVVRCLIRPGALQAPWTSREVSNGCGESPVRVRDFSFSFHFFSPDFSTIFKMNPETIRPRLKQGAFQIYTGEGKGKSTASMGLMLRALGCGFRVYYF